MEEEETGRSARTFILVCAASPYTDRKASCAPPSSSPCWWITACTGLNFPLSSPLPALAISPSSRMVPLGVMSPSAYLPYIEGAG